MQCASPLRVPRLEQITNEGDTVGQSFRLQIQIQYNGGGFSTVIDDTVSGRTGDPYQKAYLVNLGGTFPVDVRMVRITGDSNDLRLSNEFTWTSYTEIIYSRLAYPNSALVGIRIDAEQFNNIPQRSYLIRGIKVRIPNNATVDQTTGRLITQASGMAHSAQRNGAATQRGYFGTYLAPRATA
jgi:predicted phage tail protein